MEGMDELLARAYTQEQAEQDKETQTALLLTEGTYRTLPALTLTARVSDRTKVQDNGGGERGRIEYRFFAQVQHEVTGEKGGIGLTMSPDRVTNDSGRPDASSQRWTQAVTAFKTANGRDPDTLAEVAGYVRDYPVRLRIRRLEGNERFPEPSNFVVALSPVRD